MFARLKVASAETASKRAAALYFDNMTSLLGDIEQKQLLAPPLRMSDHGEAMDQAALRQRYWVTVSGVHMPAA
jgi:hypothetical protein